MVCLNSWLDYLLYFFIWICNKGVVFLSPCFPLDLFYCNRNFVSQNWPKKFVNYQRIITDVRSEETKAGYFDGDHKIDHNQRTHCWDYAVCPARSTRCTRMLAGRMGLVRFRRGDNGWFDVGDASEIGGISEQRLFFVVIAAGEEGKEKYDFRVS